MSFVINRLRSDLWKADTLASVEQYKGSEEDRYGNSR